MMHVKTFLLPEKERDLKERGLVFGGNITDSLASFDPDTQSWRTSELSLFGGLTLFSGRWPISGLMRNGTAYERQTWVRRTEGNESGLLPTPTMGDSKASGSRNTENSKAHPGISLTDAVRGDGGKGRMFPTPETGLGKMKKNEDGNYERETFPTPTAPPPHGNGSMQEWGGSGNPMRNTPEATGQLNPAWVCALMGYMPGWTDGKMDYHVSLLESKTE